MSFFIALNMEIGCIRKYIATYLASLRVVVQRIYRDNKR